jgi:hypothetical protein
MMLVIALAPRLAGGRLAAVAGSGAAFALLAATLLPAIVVLGPALAKPDRLNVPFPAFAEKVEALGFTHGAIISDSNWAAGNLLNAIPGRALTPEYQLVEVPAGEPIVFAWVPQRDDAPPAGLQALAADAAGIALAARPVQRIEARPYYAAAGVLHLNVVLVPGK